VFAESNPIDTWHEVAVMVAFFAFLASCVWAIVWATKD
jgi:hypothetical protein